MSRLALRVVVFTFTFAALFAACVPKPKQDYRVDQISQINSVTEIMRVQAHDLDPLFKKMDQASFTEGEYAAMVKAAARLQATAVALRDRFSESYDPSFKDYASQTHQEAEKLRASAGSKQAPESSRALAAIKRACADCHKQHK